MQDSGGRVLCGLDTGSSAAFPLNYQIVQLEVKVPTYRTMASIAPPASAEVDITTISAPASNSTKQVVVCVL